MSDEVVKMPTRVVGLAYELGGDLPQIVVKGVGRNADALLWRCRTAGGPPVIQDRELLDRLFRLPVDSPITPDLFQVVAIILSHVLAVNQKLKKEAS